MAPVPVTHGLGIGEQRTSVRIDNGTDFAQAKQLVSAGKQVDRIRGCRGQIHAEIRDLLPLTQKHQVIFEVLERLDAGGRQEYRLRHSTHENRVLASQDWHHTGARARQCSL